MKGSEIREQCLAMLRDFARGFDRDAYQWLVAHDATVSEVLIHHLDELATADRMNVYLTLYATFRQHYRAVMEARLRLEQDPICRSRLATIERLHRDDTGQPCLPATDEDLLSSSERNLRDDKAGMRVCGAYAVWALTKDARKVVPAMTDILKNRYGEARSEAATFLGTIFPLNEAAIRTLREIASDPEDPVQLVASEALVQSQRLARGERFPPTS